MPGRVPQRNMPNPRPNWSRQRRQSASTTRRRSERQHADVRRETECVHVSTHVEPTAAVQSDVQQAEDELSKCAADSSKQSVRHVRMRWVTKPKQVWRQCAGREAAHATLLSKNPWQSVAQLGEQAQQSNEQHTGSKPLRQGAVRRKYVKSKSARGGRAHTNKNVLAHRQLLRELEHAPMAFKNVQLQSRKATTRAKSNDVLTKVKPSLKKPTRKKRPSYLAECKQKMRQAIAEGPMKGLRQGPILDNAATVPVIAKKDWKYVTSIKKLKVPVELDGIFGTKTVEQSGNIKVNGQQYYGGLLVDTAKETVVPMHDVLVRNKVYFQDAEGAMLYDKVAKTVEELVPDGLVYRLPVMKSSHPGSKWAMEAAYQTGLKQRQHRKILVQLQHQYEMHNPKKPDCE